MELGSEDESTSNDLGQLVRGFLQESPMEYEAGFMPDAGGILVPPSSLSELREALGDGPQQQQGSEADSAHPGAPQAAAQGAGPAGLGPENAEQPLLAAFEQRLQAARDAAGNYTRPHDLIHHGFQALLLFAAKHADALAAAGRFSDSDSPFAKAGAVGQAHQGMRAGHVQSRWLQMHLAPLAVRAGGVHRRTSPLMSLPALYACACACAAGGWQETVLDTH